MINWIDVLIYVGFAVSLVLGFWAVRKFKITESDANTIKSVLKLMTYVNRQVDYRLQEQLEKIMGYVVSWTDYLIPYMDEGEYTYLELYEAFTRDANAFCEAEGITVDEELKDILDMVAEFVIGYWLGVDKRV